MVVSSRRAATPIRLASDRQANCRCLPPVVATATCRNRLRNRLSMAGTRRTRMRLPKASSAIERSPRKFLSAQTAQVATR